MSGIDNRSAGGICISEHRVQKICVVNFLGDFGQTIGNTDLFLSPFHFNVEFYSRDQTKDS